MPVTVRRTGRSTSVRLKRAYDALDGMEIIWGWTNESADYPDGTSVHMVAAVHQFGIGVPVRPILTISFDKHIDDLKVLSRLVNEALLKARTNNIEAALRPIGQSAISKLQQDFGRVPLRPLAESTIARKGHSTQLIETGHLKNQVRYQIRAG